MGRQDAGKTSGEHKGHGVKQQNAGGQTTLTATGEVPTFDSTAAQDADVRRQMGQRDPDSPEAAEFFKNHPEKRPMQP
jgi:hypothetical protein